MGGGREGGSRGGQEVSVRAVGGKGDAADARKGQNQVGGAREEAQDVEEGVLTRAHGSRHRHRGQWTRTPKVAPTARFAALAIQAPNVLHSIGDQQEGAEDVTVARAHRVATVSDRARPDGAVALVHF